MLRIAAIALLVPTASMTGATQDGHPPARVEVLDSHGKPVAAAGIFYAFESEVTPWQLEQRGIDDLDWFSKVTLLGRTARSDANGHFILPPFEGRVLVIAHRDNQFFSRSFDRRVPPFQCPLRETTPVRVRLVDAGGAPLFGEVALRASSGLEVFDLTAAPLSPLDNVAHLFGATDFEEEIEANYTMHVVQAGVFRNVPMVEVDLANPPSSPIELKGLPTGSVELTLVDSEGKPLRGEVEVSVAVVRGPTDRRVPAPARVRVTDTGKVTLPHIGLGLDLNVLIKRPFTERGATHEVKGPMAAGEVAPHRIEYEERDVLLMGRLVDEKGEPLVDDYIDVIFKTGNFLTKGEGHITVRTRADGRIQFPLICRGRAAIQNAEVKFRRQVEQVNLHLEYDWSTTTVTEAGIIDLGDMVMKRP